MNRNILLLEPNYKNKYPPLGLMKISTYHKLLGDNLTFYKGDLDDFTIQIISDQCLEKLSNIDDNVNWKKHQANISHFIRTRSKSTLSKIPLSQSKFEILLVHRLYDHSDYYRKKTYLEEKKWDRVYVSTLFTFYWNITIKTIEFAKQLVRNRKDVFVGGVMASLLPKEIYKETGIKPIEGLLDKPGVLDLGNDIIIDDLPLDYSILDEIEYTYPTGSAYFTFMTKGCTRKCSFCSVPKIEPTYKPHIPTLSKFKSIKKTYGEQQNLLLMDNNVLASPNFKDIIKEIKTMGFFNGATYTEPNQLDIAIKNLKKGLNDKAYTNRIFNLLNNLLKIINKKFAQDYYNILDKYELLNKATIKKENIIKAYPFLKDTFEKYRPKTKRFRYVDFNQGVDCRYINEDYMKLLSEIPIKPLRIAFDYIGLKEQYVNAVRLAAKYGIKELSNYILYNFNDKPEELYERLKINIDLSEELGIHIYSFPMKYIPLYGEDAKHRDFVGKYWRKKYIRSVQSILNVTKGIVAPGRTFFEKAFGKNIDEFNKLLFMPETFIVYRKVFEELNYTQNWYKQFSNLNESELQEAKSIIENSDFNFIENKTNNIKILNLLIFYKITRDDVDKADPEYLQIQTKYNELVKNDKFIELTLTYDFNEELSEDRLVHLSHNKSKKKA